MGDVKDLSVSIVKYMLDLEPDEEETGFSLAVVLMGGR